MAFERIQKQTHTIAEQTVVVSYDRFTTRFEIKNKQEVIFSSLVLSPIKTSNIVINKQKFTLKILWFFLWQSQLLNSKGIVVQELLERRRRKSISLLVYFMLIISVKIGLGLMA